MITERPHIESRRSNTPQRKVTIPEIAPTVNSFTEMLVPTVGDRAEAAQVSKLTRLERIRAFYLDSCDQETKRLPQPVENHSGSYLHIGDSTLDSSITMSLGATTIDDFSTTYGSILGYTSDSSVMGYNTMKLLEVRAFVAGVLNGEYAQSVRENQVPKMKKIARLEHKRSEMFLNIGKKIRDRVSERLKR